MPPRSARHRLQFLSLVLLALTFTGCVSTKYKAAPKDTPPPIAIDLKSDGAGFQATLNTVVVFGGPGSWKKEAYWDEYVLTLVNPGATPLSVTSASLVDGLGAPQSPGLDPWDLEQLSKENIQKFEHTGRRILLGAGLVVGWVGAVGFTAAAAWAGAGAAAAVGAAAVVALPVWAIDRGINNLIGRSRIRTEFDRRRLVLPLALAPGASRQGSFFFPISPAPQRLQLVVRGADGDKTVTIDLAPLSGLHLLKELPGQPAAKP